MDLVTQDFLTKPMWMWAAFLALAVVLLVQDSGVPFAILAAGIFWSLWRTHWIKADVAAP